MSATLAVISIIVLTLLVWGFNRFKLFAPVCPICAGVSLTWIWMFIAYLVNYNIDLTVVAILIGGSAVGVADLLTKRFQSKASLFKSVFILVGLSGAYFLVSQNWILFIVAILALFFTYYLFKSLDKPSDIKRVDDIKKGLKNCC